MTKSAAIVKASPALVITSTHNWERRCVRNHVTGISDKVGEALASAHEATVRKLDLESALEELTLQLNDINLAVWALRWEMSTFTEGEVLNG